MRLSARSGCATSGASSSSISSTWRSGRAGSESCGRWSRNRKDRSPSKILQFNDFAWWPSRARGRSLPRARPRAALPSLYRLGDHQGCETVCYEIQQELRKMMAEVDGKEITIRVGDEVAKALKSGGICRLSDLEEEAKRISEFSPIDAGSRTLRYFLIRRRVTQGMPGRLTSVETRPPRRSMGGRSRRPGSRWGYL